MLKFFIFCFQDLNLAFDLIISTAKSFYSISNLFNFIFDSLKLLRSKKQIFLSSKIIIKNSI